MPSIVFGYGSLLPETAERLHRLAERHRVTFVQVGPTEFRVEAEFRSDAAKAFAAALKRDDGFYQALQREVELFDGGEDVDDIPF